MKICKQSICNRGINITNAYIKGGLLVGEFIISTVLGIIQTVLCMHAKINAGYALF